MRERESVRESECVCVCVLLASDDKLLGWALVTAHSHTLKRGDYFFL